MDSAIVEYINKKRKLGESANIIIAGSTCAGKSTLAKKIYDTYSLQETVTILPQDNYFKDLPDIPKSSKGVLADSPNAFHLDEYRIAAINLLKYGYIDIPVYNLSTNKRMPATQRKNVGTINIFEGLHTILTLRNDIAALKIYLDPGNDECLERRINRDFENWGIKEEFVKSYWNNCIKPITDEYIRQQKNFANIILEGNVI